MNEVIIRLSCNRVSSPGLHYVIAMVDINVSMYIQGYWCEDNRLCHQATCT